MVTLAIMGCGTLLIALVPGYHTIGVLAPILVLVGRLLQGFSAGVELGGVSVYLSEIATPGNKGFYTSWQSASQQVAIVMAALIGYALNATLEHEEIADWGWRIPFFIGCLIIPLIFVLRRSLQETEEFLQRKHRPDTKEILTTIVRNLAHYYRGDITGGDDHHHLLFYHRLYADLRQSGAAPQRSRQPAGDHAGGHLQLYLVTDWRGDL